MSMVEIHLPQPLFVLSNQCVTQRSRLRVLLHFTDNTYNFGVFCFGLANCYFADRGAKRERKKLNHPVRDKNENRITSRLPFTRPESAIAIEVFNFPQWGPCDSNLGLRQSDTGLTGHGYFLK